MSGMIDFVMNHEVVLAGLGVAIVDLVLALMPGDQSGILHGLLTILQKMAQPKA